MWWLGPTIIGLIRLYGARIIIGAARWASRRWIMMRVQDMYDDYQLSLYHKTLQANYFIGPGVEEYY